MRFDDLRINSFFTHYSLTSLNKLKVDPEIVLDLNHKPETVQGRTGSDGSYYDDELVELNKCYEDCDKL